VGVDTGSGTGSGTGEVAFLHPPRVIINKKTNKTIIPDGLNFIKTPFKQRFIGRLLTFNIEYTTNYGYFPENGD